MTEVSLKHVQILFLRLVGKPILRVLNAIPTNSKMLPSCPINRQSGFLLSEKSPQVIGYTVRKKGSPKAQLDCNLHMASYPMFSSVPSQKERSNQFCCGKNITLVLESIQQ